MMFRRDFIKYATCLPVIPLFSTSLLGQRPDLLLNDTVVVQIGKFKCTMFRDWMFKYLAKDYFINVDVEEVTQSLKRFNNTPENIPSPFIATLIETENKKVLIDTGIGYADKPIEFRGNAYSFKGKLDQLLKEQGIEHSKITDVIITHFHPDHIGGLTSEDGVSKFSNARIHIHEDEWNYWHSHEADNQPPLFKYFIQQKINPLLKLHLNIFSGDFVELVSGVTALKAQGHTPGQIAVNISSESKQLLYISDAFLHPLHIEKTNWQTNYDLDHNKARKTREKLSALAYEEKMLVNAFHFDFPGLGTIDKANNGWFWNNQNDLYTNK